MRTLVLDADGLNALAAKPALAADRSAAARRLSERFVAGVWLHGRAGDIAAHDFGEYSMIAGDITSSLSLAFPEGR